MTNEEEAELLDQAVFTSEDPDVAFDWGRSAGVLFPSEPADGSLCVSSDMQIIWELKCLPESLLWVWVTRGGAE
jgi:hypothetical protein